jgi:hypothetical protein
LEDRHLSNNLRCTSNQRERIERRPADHLRRLVDDSRNESSLASRRWTSPAKSQSIQCGNKDERRGESVRARNLSTCCCCHRQTQQHATARLAAIAIASWRRPTKQSGHESKQTDDTGQHAPHLRCTTTVLIDTRPLSPFHSHRPSSAGNKAQYPTTPLRHGPGNPTRANRSRLDGSMVAHIRTVQELVH